MSVCAPTLGAHGSLIETHCVPLLVSQAFVATLACPPPPVQAQAKGTGRLAFSSFTRVVKPMAEFHRSVSVNPWLVRVHQPPRLHGPAAEVGFVQQSVRPELTFASWHWSIGTL